MNDYNPIPLKTTNKIKVKYKRVGPLKPTKYISEGEQMLGNCHGCGLNVAPELITHDLCPECLVKTAKAIYLFEKQILHAKYFLAFCLILQIIIIGIVVWFDFIN